MNIAKKTGFMWLMTALLLISSAQARDFSVKALSVENLDSYSKSNVTLYLVSASKVFGAEFTVSKVFKVLKTVPVNGRSSIDFGPFTIKQNWSSFRNPNAIVAVVHDQPQHALNKHGIIDGTPTVFAEPEYQNENERVEPTDSNKKLRLRAAATFSELDQFPNIRL